MKFTCPHCNDLTIPYFSKWVCTPVFPASCPSCHNLSSVRHITLYVLAILAELIFWGVIIFSLWMWSLWPLFIGLAIYFAIKIGLTNYVPLKQTNIQQVKKQRLIAIGVIVFVFVGVLVAGVVDSMNL